MVRTSLTRRYEFFCFRFVTHLYSLFQYYDPRVWVREGEKTMSVRVKEACEDLGNVGMLF